MLNLPGLRNALDILNFVKLIRLKRPADPVFLAEPFAQIDQLAPLRAEWRRCRGPGFHRSPASGASGRWRGRVHVMMQDVTRSWCSTSGTPEDPVILIPPMNPRSARKTSRMRKRSESRDFRNQRTSIQPVLHARARNMPEVGDIALRQCGFEGGRDLRDAQIQRSDSNTPCVETSPSLASVAAWWWISWFQAPSCFAFRFTPPVGECV